MRLLIATGGGVHSSTAVQLGAEIARTAGEEPTILTVIRRRSEHAKADKILAQASQIVGREGQKVRTLIRMGNPAEAILTEATKGRYDLIIVGERQEHHLMTRFLGSTTKRVVERAPCPVIVAKGRIAPIHRILLCDSGAESDSLLDQFAARLVNLAQQPVEITVLHVMSQISAGPGVPGKQLRADAKELIQERSPEGELLERDIQILERLNLHPDTKVRHGLVVNEILGEAQSGNYDLIVIGAHRGAGWQHFLLEDIAYQIMTHADRPVLVLR